jgi:hypothetical protein
MRIAAATEADFDAFLALARQVEHWFGPMVRDTAFHSAIRANIDRGSARQSSQPSLLGVTSPTWSR